MWPRYPQNPSRRSLGRHRPSISGRRLHAFFGCLYYAALRPGEALGLRRSDCTLRRTGWGRIELTETWPSAGKSWTDSGEAHDRRGLKQRRARRGSPDPASARTAAPGARGRVRHPRKTGGSFRVSTATWWRASALPSVEAGPGAGSPARTGRLRYGCPPVRPPHAGVSQWLNSEVAQPRSPRGPATP